MYAKHLMLASLVMVGACSHDTRTLDVSAHGTPAPDASVTRMCLPSQVKPPALAATPCPILNCGDNAPNAGDGLLFDELDLFGHENYAHVRLFGPLNAGKILSATWPDSTGTEHPAWIDIKRDELIVHDDMGRSHQGQELIGTVIRLQYVPKNKVFELRVACYEDHAQQFLAGPSEFVRVYDFQARLQTQDNSWFEVCNQPVFLDDSSWTGTAYHALLYRGDRYTRDKTVLPPALNDPRDPSNGWSFLACNGSVGSKLHLHRHTYAGGIDSSGVEMPGVMTTVDERTTLFKAITADYCGTGRSFTQAGHHLAFATARDPSWFSRVWTSGVTSFEAVWQPTGAACLDQPRLNPPWTRDAVETGPDGCGRTIDPCYPGKTTLPTMPDWTTTGYVITGDPR